MISSIRPFLYSQSIGFFSLPLSSSRSLVSIVNITHSHTSNSQYWAKCISFDSVAVHVFGKCTFHTLCVYFFFLSRPMWCDAIYLFFFLSLCYCSFFSLSSFFGLALSLVRRLWVFFVCTRPTFFSIAHKLRWTYCQCTTFNA